MAVAINYSEKYYSTAEAAKRLGVGTDTIKRYCNATPQRLKGEKVGSIWMIPKSEVERYRKEEHDRGRPKKSTRRAS